MGNLYKWKSLPRGLGKISQTLSYSILNKMAILNFDKISISRKKAEGRLLLLDHFRFLRTYVIYNSGPGCYEGFLNP
jgi:hypothetical protein